MIIIKKQNSAFIISRNTCIKLAERRLRTNVARVGFKDWKSVFQKSGESRWFGKVTRLLVLRSKGRDSISARSRKNEPGHLGSPLKKQEADSMPDAERSGASAGRASIRDNKLIIVGERIFQLSFVAGWYAQFHYLNCANKGSWPLVRVDTRPCLD